MVSLWPPRRGSTLTTEEDTTKQSTSENSSTRAGADGDKDKLGPSGVVYPVDPDADDQQSAEDLTKRELTLGEGWDYTGFAFPTWRKWSILSSVFLVQISMNYNASAYANAVSGLTEEYGISSFQARLGQMVFLVAYVSPIDLQNSQQNVPTNDMRRRLVARPGLLGQRNWGDSGYCKALCSWSTFSRSRVRCQRTGRLWL
jgi:hypothetical protein